MLIRIQLKKTCKKLHLLPISLHVFCFYFIQYADPGGKMNADPSGSGSTALLEDEISEQILLILKRLTLTILWVSGNNVHDVILVSIKIRRQNTRDQLHNNQSNTWLRMVEAQLWIQSGDSCYLNYWLYQEEQVSWIHLKMFLSLSSSSSSENRRIVKLFPSVNFFQLIYASFVSIIVKPFQNYSPLWKKVWKCTIVTIKQSVVSRVKAGLNLMFWSFNRLWHFSPMRVQRAYLSKQNVDVTLKG